MAFEKLAENLGLDADEFIELVELFIETAQQDLEKILAAIDEGDSAQVIEAAHSLKGSSGNLGFTEISASASKIEEMAKAGDLDNLEELSMEIQDQIDEIKNQAF